VAVVTPKYEPAAVIPHNYKQPHRQVGTQRRPEAILIY